MKGKKILSTLPAALALCMAMAPAAWAEETDVVAINEINFPDETFRTYVANHFDTDGNDGLSQDELNAVTSMRVAISDISDLKGIEYFTKLTSLECYDNQLTSLDLSKNTALEKLYCYNNQFTSLDVSKNTDLTDLWCDRNQLTSLDVSMNTDLTSLDCGDNQLTSLDVSKNTDLTSLDCDNNQLTSLDVSKNTALKSLKCENNLLTSIDLSKNTDLTDLWCDRNQLTSLDLSKNTALINLSCTLTQLTSLDISNNTALKLLQCPYNQLTSLDLSKNTALKTLYCYNNNLTSLDVSKNTALTDLNFAYNQLTSLDVSKNTALTLLYCGNNQLTSLDVSKNTALTDLYCSGNSYSISNVNSSYLLSNLPEGFDPGKASNWVGAQYDEESKSLINISSETITYDYDCGNGNKSEFKLTVTWADVLAVNEETFPDDTFRQYISVNFDNDNSGGLTRAEIDAVTEIKISGTSDDPGNVADLTGIEYFTKLTSLDCSYNQLTSLDVSKNTALEKLYCYNNQLTSLDVSNNTALTDFRCSENQLTSLDVSKNTSLVILSCNDNQLKSLDVSNNAALYQLSCNNNKLTSIDVSKNTALRILSCYENQLTSIDISKNTALNILSCSDNQLVNLDVSNNTALATLSCEKNQIKSLNVSRNTILRYLNCSSNQITSLDVSKNTDLEDLYCSSNPLTSLDISNNTALKFFNFYGDPYNIGAVSGSYSLANLPGNFDPSKVLKWYGAEYDFSTNSLKNFTSKTVWYSYDCGNDYIGEFSLTADLFPDLPSVKATAGDSKVSLSWNAVTGATKYRVFYRLNGTTSWTYKDTTATSYTVSGLTGGKKYDFLVSAYNGTNWSEYTDADIKTAIPAVAYPALPSFKVAAGEEKATISWNAVTGATKYRVFYRLNGTTSWTYKDTTATSYTVSGLTGGKKYDFLVLAYNGKWSKYTTSNIVNATPVASTPALPTVKATAGNASVALSWNAVTGATKYRVFYRLNGTTSWTYKDTTATSYTVSGLTGGKKYDFLVRAYNGTYWSKYTNADIKYATPAVAYPALPSLKVAAGDTKATLSWNAVTGATKYRVFYRLNGTTSWTSKDTTATSYTVTGLTNSKKYDFLVLAYNGTKWSKYTTANIISAAPVASSVAPALPTVKATAGNASVALSWNAVSGAVKYRVFYRVNGTSSWISKDTTAASYTVSGLTNGKKYDFLVLAGSTNAWSKWTNSNIIYATPVASSVVPALPTVKAAPGNAQTVLSWNSVSGAVKYRVFYRLNGTSAWTSKDTTATSYTVTCLTNGKKYDFLVLAGSTNAWSKWTNSNIINATPLAAPALPTVKATAGNASVALSWNAVSGASKYRVFYRVSGTSAWTSKDTTSTSYTITGLTNGKKYDILVLTGSTNAWSKYTSSNIVNVTPKA